MAKYVPCLNSFSISNPIIGVSLEEAWQAAEKWIAERQEVESASAAEV